MGNEWEEEEEDESSCNLIQIDFLNSVSLSTVSACLSPCARAAERGICLLMGAMPEETLINAMQPRIATANSV